MSLGIEERKNWYWALSIERLAFITVMSLLEFD